MYPLYWTPSKEGIFMRYSYEFVTGKPPVPTLNP